MTRDEAIYNQTCKAAIGIRLSVSMFKWYKLESVALPALPDGEEETIKHEMFVFVAATRGRDPALALFAEVRPEFQDDGALQLTIVLEGGMVRCLAQWGVAKSFFSPADERSRATQVARIDIAELEVCSVPNRPLTVRVVPSDAAKKCVWQRGRRPKKGVTSADEKLLEEYQQMFADFEKAFDAGTKGEGCGSGKKMNSCSDGPAEDDVSTDVPSTKKVLAPREVVIAGEDSDDWNSSASEIEFECYAEDPGLDIVDGGAASDKDKDKDEDKKKPASPAPVPTEPPPRAIVWWLSRTNRKGTCTGCNETIDAQAFRLIYEPQPHEVSNPKVWKQGFWKYYHVRATCLRHHHAPLQPDDELGVEVAHLPARCKETLPEYHLVIAAQKVNARRAFADIPALSGAASSSGLVR